jgi:hypothetical protein
MAEFKLGRIRFIWKNNWAAATTYVKDDIVRYGGKTFLCVVGHVADADFYTDLDNIPTRWNQVSDGSAWKDNWTVNTYYKINDIVKFGGILYLCNEGHTSDALASSGASPEVTAGLEADQSKWDVYATSFDWKTDWNAATRYKKNDIVRYGSTSYVCTIGHTSAATATLGLEADQGSWDIYAKGFDWKTNWTTNFRYKRNDVILYGGTTYVCNTGHTSAATATLGLEADQGLWDYFHKGIEFKGTWSPSSVRYKVNDVVKYGADLWICKLDHTSASLFSDSTNWILFVGGLEFENSWSGSAVYQPGDVVSYGGYAYIAKTNHTNKLPTANVADWDLFTTGFSFQGDWATAQAYKVGQVLRLNGYTYVTILDHTSSSLNFPPNLTYWARLNSGFKWAATPQTFTGVTGTNVIGTGSSAVFTITASGTYYQATVTTAGTGYAVNNTIKVLGSALGGISPANDLVITISAISGGGGTGPISTVTPSGYSVTWKTGVDYYLGDTVYYGVNSYTCILSHTSGSGNRPDNDLTGANWNLLSVGALSSTLSTQGDTLYYGPGGPTRLPIGTDGQVLRVTGNGPTWSYFGVINNVVYVATSGTDVTGNGQGLTLDKPFKTVQYAAKQVEDGYLNPNAALLINKNKQFLIKEVSNFVTYTYTVAITAASGGAFSTSNTSGIVVNMPIVFTGTIGGVTVGQVYYVKAIIANTSFTISATQVNGVAQAAVLLVSGSGSMTGQYDFSASKTERDSGFIVDALAYDISHGGNGNTTAITLSYLNTVLGSGYISGVLSGEIPIFIAAQNVLSSLISNVLANAVPSTNYQSLNSVALGSRGIQQIDTTIIAETGTTTTVSNLILLLTSGLAAAASTSVKAAIFPNTTISIKTGAFAEVLPIIVSKNVAVVGDELRSTNISPAPANPMLINDKPKSINALSRLRALVPTLISNTVITPTSGNTQVITTTAASSSAGTSTIIFAQQAFAPFVVGQQITVTGVTPSGFNGAKTVIACTTTSVSFTGSTAGPQTVAGTITSQVTGLPIGSVGSSTAVARVQNSTAVISNILRNGLIVTPAFTFTNPTGYNTSYLVGYGDGKAQIVQNYRYIKTYISQYLFNNYLSIYNAINVASCQRDVEYLLDALQYDMTYGGNLQTLIAGSAYYSNSILTIASTERTATLAAYSVLKTMIGSVVQGTAPSANSPNTTFSTTGFIVDTTLTISTAVTGTIMVGHQLTMAGSTAGTVITGYVSGGAGAGSVWTVSVSQVVGSVGSPVAVSGANPTQVTAGAAGSAGAATFAQSRIQDVIDWITNSASPTSIPPTASFALVSTELQTAFTALQSAKTEIQADTVSWVNKFYQGVNFNSATCSRDTGYIVDAMSYDLAFGTNFNSVKAGQAYYRATPSAQFVIANQLNPEIGSVNFVGAKAETYAASGATAQITTIIDDIISGIAKPFTTTTIASFAPVSTAVSSSAGTDITVATSITLSPLQPITFSTSFGNVVAGTVYFVNAYTHPTLTITTVQGSGSAFTVGTGGTGTMTAPAVVQLTTNQNIRPNFRIVFSGATALGNLTLNRIYWVGATYGTSFVSVTPLFDAPGSPVALTASTNSITATINSGLEVHGTNTYNNTLGIINGAEILRANKTFLSHELAAFITNSYGGTVTNTTSGTNLITVSAAHNLTVGDPVIFTGTAFGNIVSGTSYYVATVSSATQFTVTSTQGSITPASLTTASGSCTVRYNFNATSCRRDTAAYIDAIVYDLQYTGNYKSLRAATLYNNAVSGSQLSDMFYLRNGTGLRNCTTSGLSGSLTAPNVYGTRRPTAGAYTSLDPGYGPRDTNVWITLRSPYVQNVTTFGTACVGLKIDGALHSAGNRSIVSNDFTQVLSDGIGIWCTGSNSLTEAVSVFSYYNYIGYLAELGGKIRATNGNNSYGTYGSLAEGVDTFETAITATVNNRYNPATITNVVTDSVNQILRLEFANAGSNYNAVTYSLGGTGFNAAAVGNEFRDNAVFQTRVLTAGTNFVTQANTAQGGSLGFITLAATDQAINAAYPGMRIQVTGGTGAGNVGAVLDYNSGTKIAKVFKESFTTLTVTATTVTNNLLTVASTATLHPGMAIYLGTTINGIVANQLYYINTANFSATQFQVSLAAGGSGLAVTITGNSTGLTVLLYAAGFDHIVPGTTIVNGLDLTSSYIVEPRITFTGPGFTSTARTQINAAWSDVTYGATIASYSSISATGGTGINAAYNIARTGVAYVVTQGASGSGYSTGDTLTIAGTSVGGVAPLNNITITVTAVNLGAITNFTYTGVGSGGYFVAVASGSTATQISSNGTSWAAGGVLTSNTLWTSMAYGNGRWVTVSNLNATSNYTTDPTAPWTAGGTITGGAAGWQSICYGNGVFMAVQTGGTGAAYSTTGVTWVTSGPLPASTSWTGVAYGAGVYVAIASGGTQAASSVDGTTWVSRTLPATANWSSVTFGRGVFVAVATGSRTSAYSKDGITWILAGAGLPVSAAWADIRYGQGLFFAVATGSTSVAATSEDGILWTSRTLAGAAASWPAVAFGNPSANPIWIALTSGTTAATSIVTGATARARVKVAAGQITEIRMIEPGSGYTAPPTATIVDSNATVPATVSVRTGIGALANPTFSNRGLQYATATASVNTGNGYADEFQTGFYINLAGLPSEPTPGSNVVFAGNSTYYKLVQVSNFLGTGAGSIAPYTGRLQLSPAFTVATAPAHGTAVELRIKYSQVRLTGHDFLSIGTGNVITTNYPGTPLQLFDVNKQTVSYGGGRVFYTSTDQDGNFNVGTLFSVEQATGVASINADAFNLAGLNALTLGSVALGGSGATVTQFSTDPFFTANSDNIVPTQKAIKSYVSSQIGGGSSSLNVNTLTAGVIFISGNSISTTTGVQINVTATMNFTGGINGMPIAMNLLLLG